MSHTNGLSIYNTYKFILKTDDATNIKISMKKLFQKQNNQTQRPIIPLPPTR